MKKFISHTGIGVPLRRSNVDTDQIIPAVYLKRVTKTGFEDGLFAAWRQDKDFVLNLAPFRNGSILVAGPDFGTGSSREHAVWALRDYGFRVVLAPKFADIFRGNCEKDGMVAAVISPEECQTLWKMLEAEPGKEITVDLEKRLVTCGSFSCSFQIDDYTRWRLLEGLDDIDLTLRDEEAISAYEEARPDFMPRTLPAKHLPPAEVVSAREVTLGIPEVNRS